MSSRRAVAGGALAAVAFVVVAWLAVATTADIVDRTEAGFCRPSALTGDLVTVEERTWWPLGERCSIELPDGTLLVREQTWRLTAFAAGWLAVFVVGVVAPPRSTRRVLAAVVAIPFVALAFVEVVAILDRVSLSRVVAITTVSLAFGLLPAAVTAVGVWWVTRGRVVPIVVASWIGWALAVLLAARDGIQP